MKLLDIQVTRSRAYHDGKLLFRGEDGELVSYDGETETLVHKPSDPNGTGFVGFLKTEDTIEPFLQTVGFGVRGVVADTVAVLRDNSNLLAYACLTFSHDDCLCYVEYIVSNPMFRQQGAAKELLSALVSMYGLVYAHIRLENTASIKLFESVGFRLRPSSGIFITSMYDEFSEDFYSGDGYYASTFNVRG
jgi:ribosomal protein S18 acetylase RimI-like enzyme